LGLFSVVPLKQKPILIVCNDLFMANELAVRITKARGEVVHAANTLEALERLKIVDCVAAVLMQQVDTAAVAARLRESHVPCCILDKTARKPVSVFGQDTVAVDDTDLVVPTLQALLAQRDKPR
jgi:hypothetical protein